MYVEQYITVVAPTSTLSTIKLDGKPVNVVKFVPIPPSNEYSFAWLGGKNGADGMTDGAHTITADLPIGIYIYGYGEANSYGYAGGMDLTGLVSAVDEQAVDADEITISPNPTASSVSITCNSMVLSYKVVNSLGEEIFGQIIPSGQRMDRSHDVDMTGVASGVYFVLFRTSMGVISKPIIVIQ